MKRSRSVYEQEHHHGDNKENSNEEFIVSSVITTAIMHYYDKDPTIQNCARSLTRSVFEEEFDYYIGWDPEESMHISEMRPKDNGIRPSLFNTDSFITELRAVLVRARDYVRVTGGVAMWAVEDFPLWLFAYIQARSDTERHDLGLPMGVLESRDYSLKVVRNQGHHYQYIVMPSEETRRKHRRFACRYRYYNHETTLLPADPAVMDACKRRIGRAMSPSLAQTVRQSELGVPADRLLMVRSSFIELNQMAEELEGERINLMDASWLRAHPQMVMRTIPDQPLAPEQVPDSDLYASNSVYEAGMRVRRHQRRHTFQDGINFLSTLQRSMGIRTGQSSIRQQQRDYYRHPDMLQDTVLLEEAIEVVQWDPPALLNDYSLRREEYVDQVTVAMGIGENSRLYQAVTHKLQKEQHGVAGKSQVAMLAEQRQQQNVVRQEQSIYQKLFARLYEFAGFADRDAQALSATIESLDATIKTMQTTSAKGISIHEGVRMLLYSDREVEDAQTTAEKKVMTIKQMGITVKRVKAWYERLRANPEIHMAKLVFQNKADEENLLQFMLERHATGHLDTKVLETQAQRVFDERVKLRDPPVEEGAGAAAGPKKKKQKTTKKETKKQ